MRYDKEKHRIALLFIAALLSTACIAYAQSSAGVQANVDIVCPFSLALSTGSAYTYGSNVPFTYNAQTVASCSLTGVSGNLVIYNSLSDPVYSNTISGLSLSQTPVSGNILAYTYNLPADSYTATLYLSSNVATNSSSANFQILSAANVTVASLSASPTVQQFAQQSITANVVNVGSFSTTSNSVLRIFISGPESFEFTYNIIPLTPSQSQILSIGFDNITGIAGTYSVSANVLFTSNSVQYVSKTLSTNYQVSASGGGGGGHPANATLQPQPLPSVQPINVVPQLSFTYVPLYVSVQENSSTQLQLGIQNTGGSVQRINVTIPSPYDRFLQVSSPTTYINPGKSLNIQLLFSVLSGTQPGTYIIPVRIQSTSVNITGLSGLGPALRGSTYISLLPAAVKRLVTYGLGKAIGYSGSSVSSINTTEFITISVSPSAPQNLTVNNQMALTNNTNTAEGTVTISAPENQPLYNVTVEARIPSRVTDSISEISASGLPSNITFETGAYVISWYVAYLPAGQVTYGYYQINNVSLQTHLLTTQTLYSQPSVQTPQSLLDIFSPSIPAFYPNSTKNISMTVLYTGTSEEQLKFFLSGPSDVVIFNATQNIDALPNRLITLNYPVQVKATSGTLIFDLKTSGRGANLTYSFPVLVFPGVQQAPASQQQGSQLPQLGNYELFLYIGIFLMVIIIGILLIRRPRRIGTARSRHMQDSAAKLTRLKDQIDRSADDE